MEILSLVVVVSFGLMVLLGAVALLRGRRLKAYLKQKDPGMFALFYGAGTILSKRPHNDLARIRFVHGSGPNTPSDPSLLTLRQAVRTVERLYMFAFAATVAAFIALVLCW